MERKFNSFMASFNLKPFLINSATKQILSMKRYCLVYYVSYVREILTFIYSAPMSFHYIFTEMLKKALYGTKCDINVLFDEIYASCLLARYTFGLKTYYCSLFYFYLHNLTHKDPMNECNTRRR